MYKIFQLKAWMVEIWLYIESVLAAGYPKNKAQVVREFTCIYPFFPPVIKHLGRSLSAVDNFIYTHLIQYINQLDYLAVYASLAFVLF